MCVSKQGYWRHWRGLTQAWLCLGGLAMLLGLLTPPSATAAGKAKHSLYYMGSLSTGLQTGPIRLGIYDFELGILGAGTNGYSLGVARIFHDGNTYTGLGPVVAGYSVFGRQSPGLFACLGLEYEWLSFLFFRAELYMSVLADGATEGGPLLGLAVGW